jgi:ABC-type bacteriocin/lantibiotic exporter with double-glycine peptidase domain
MGLTLLLMAALTLLQQVYLLRLEAKVALTTASAFFWHVVRLPIEFFSLRYAGDVASRVQLNERIAQLLSAQLATNILNLAMIAFYAAIMLQYDLALTAIGVGIALLNVLALRYVSRKRTDATRRLEQDHGKLLSTPMGGLQIAETSRPAVPSRTSSPAGPASTPRCSTPSRSWAPTPST